MARYLGDRGEGINRVSAWTFEPGSVGDDDLGPDISRFMRDPGQYIVDNFNEGDEGSGFDPETWSVQINTVNNDGWRMGQTIGGMGILFHGLRIAALLLYKDRYDNDDDEDDTT